MAPLSSQSMQAEDLVIDVHHLSKKFGDLQAVQDFSIQLKRGRIFGFLGPNGSGKTTTIRMLCGLLKPDSGSGTCLGFDVLKEANKIKEQVGYMTQRFSLYDDLTVWENLALVGRLHELKPLGDHLNASLEQMGLADRKNQLAGTLSGGWKQRLALAACMLHHPQLLLLDEPTAGVDPLARREFWDQIHHFASQGVTVLVSTHYMDEVERCHEIAYILKGHLLTQGTVDTIIDESGLIAWLVSGPELLSLAAQLKGLPGVKLLSFMGSALRVTSDAPEQLKQTLAPFRKKKLYSWEEVRPSAEDLFIHLTGETV